MRILETSTFLSYFVVVLIITLFSYHKQKSDTDFVIGNRSLSFWLTALSAHASDMSNWLFMAYPALIFTSGLFNAWVAIGLIFFMFLNWQLIAPRIRILTGKMNNLTLNAYFESRFNDQSGLIRTVAAIMTFFFYLFYVSAGLVGLGLLVHSLFGLHYFIGITFGLGIVAFYVFIGGYVTVAWIDLFQGMFLLGVILFVPCYLLGKIGSIETVLSAMETKNLTTQLFPSFSLKTFTQILLISFGWGLGYLGQPHIITKFMGIKKVQEMNKAKYLGLSWQTLALLSATAIGAIGVVLLPEGLANPELITIEIVKTSLARFFSGLILCAILAATTNVIAAQVLVVASSMAEDFYKRWINKNASHIHILRISRHSVIFIAILAYLIACFKPATIYELVFYAWAGLGASFGPLILLSLYSKKINKKGAFAGILTGGICAAIWPYFNYLFHWSMPSLIPSFFVSLLSIFLFSFFSDKKNHLQKLKGSNK